MTIWKVTVSKSGDLLAELLRSFPVFHGRPMERSLSLVNNSLLRFSCDRGDNAVFTFHQWDEKEGDSIEHFILLPQAADLVGRIERVVQPC